MTAPVARAATRGEVAAVAVVAVAPLLLFVTKAISIDAPVFVAVAKQIVAHPLDPFGFQMVWDPTSPDVWVFNRNPPLVSYYLAPWIRIFGDADTWLHVAMLPFSLLAALSFLGICRRVADAGVAPVLLLVATPAYLVLATTVMVDVALLAFTLLAVYALLRGTEAGGWRWQLLAGGAAAAAGLTKYVGLSVAPLLAAGALLLAPRRAAALARVLLPPLVLWALWGAASYHLYGSVHFTGSTDVIVDRGLFDADKFWNQVSSVPVYYGGALLFPIVWWARGIGRANFETGLAVTGALIGLVVVQYVLPNGEPPRRVPLAPDEATLGALGFAGAWLLWGAFLRPARLRAGPVDAFLLLWLGGYLVFSLFLNWHVNAADALLVAAPALLLIHRDPELRPSRGLAAAALALMAPLSLLLAWADAQQANVYREAAAMIASEIGDQPGARYFVGHWGLQHYLEREGFKPVLPPHYGRSELAVGDWIASARNVSQIDVKQHLSEYGFQPVWSWEWRSALPLRTTNADAGGGFYSHHSGYVPFAWSRLPLDQVGLGRVVAIRGRRGEAP